MFKKLRKVFLSIRRPDNLKIGLALGGGGVRGLAHVGVISVLKRENIPVNNIAGSSMGAIVAAALTLNPEYGSQKLKHLLEELEDSIPDHLKIPAEKSDSLLTKLRLFINVERFILDTISGWSVLPEDLAKKTLEKLTLDKKIEEATIPIAIVSVDLLSGEKVVFKDGPAAIALQASSAIPGFLPPVLYKDMFLVDGAILDVVPADITREMGAEIVIAVDVDQSGPRPQIKNGLDAFLRAVELSSQYNKRQFLKEADIIIRPDFGQEILTFDVSKADVCISAGVKAAEDALPKILNLIE
jgi:NTE family protein